jgi:hypothetical protein
MNFRWVTACQTLGLSPNLAKSDIMKMTLTNIDREFALHLIRTFPDLHDKIDPSFFDDIEIALEYILSYDKNLTQFHAFSTPLLIPMILDKHPDLLLPILRCKRLIQYIPNSLILKNSLKIFEYMYSKNEIHSLVINPRLNRDQIFNLLKRGIYDRDVMGEHVKDDRELSLVAMNCPGFSIKVNNDLLRQDREIAKASSRNAGDFIYVDPELQVDKEIVSLFILNDNIKLDQIPENLQNDPFIHRLLMDMSSGMKIYSGAYIDQDASRYKISKNNKDFILAMAANKHFSLTHVKEIYHDDKDVVLACITSTGSDLEFASERLRDDDEVVLASLSPKHDTLQYASTRIRDHTDIVSRFVEINGDNLKHASARLRADLSLLTVALNTNPSALNDSTCVQTPDLVLQTLKSQIKNPSKPKARFNIQFQMDREFILSAVNIDGSFIKQIDRSILDREIVLTAIRNGGCLRYAPEYESDDEIFEEAIKHTGNECFIKNIFPDHPRYHRLWTVFLKAYSSRKTELNAMNLDDFWQHDRQMSMLALANQYVLNINLIFATFKHDKSFILEALSKIGQQVGDLSHFPQWFAQPLWKLILPEYQYRDAEVMLKLIRIYPLFMSKCQGMLGCSLSFVLECFRINFTLALVYLSHMYMNIIPSLNLARLYLMFSSSKSLNFVYRSFNELKSRLEIDEYLQTKKSKYATLASHPGFCDLSPNDIPLRHLLPSTHSYPAIHQSILYNLFTHRFKDCFYTSNYRFPMVQYQESLDPLLASMCNRSFNAIGACVVFASKSLITSFCVNVFFRKDAKSFSFPNSYENGFGQPVIDCNDILIY